MGLTLLSLLINFSNSHIWYIEWLFCYYSKVWIISTLQWMDVAYMKMQTPPGCYHVMWYESLPLVPFSYFFFHMSRDNLGISPAAGLTIKWCNSQSVTDTSYSLAGIRSCNFSCAVQRWKPMQSAGSGTAVKSQREAAWLSCNLSWNASPVTKKSGVWANGGVKTAVAQPHFKPFSWYSHISAVGALEANTFPL